MDAGIGSGPYRFGVFEADARAGELRRSGSHVPLQNQPFEILCALLEKPGQVVTREELRARVWRSGVYLDFEHGLNKAMGKLRAALGDDADCPRFIETLPRHGYRFIADVSRAPPVDRVTPRLPESAAALPAPDRTARGARFPQRRWTAAAALTAAALAVFWLGSRPAPQMHIVETVQLTHSPTTKYPLLQGDGQSLYFNEISPSGAIAIMRVPARGGDAHALEFGIPNLLMYSLSPDGTELLAAAVPPAEYALRDHELWRLPLRGGAPVRLGSVRANWASWSRDGKRIYYYDGFDPAARGRLSVVARDGSGAHVLMTTNGAETDVIESPDGRHLRYTTGDPSRPEIWEAGIDGGAPHPLLPGWNPGMDTCCGRWTSDGASYIFQGSRAGRSDLWMLGGGHFWRGATAPVRLSWGPMSLSSPLPAPDGRTVYAFGEQSQGELVHYDAQRRMFVPFLGGISADGVNFTADGQYVVYTTYPQAELWRMRIDGTDRRQLTFQPMQAALPVWSPDRRRIAFMAREHPAQPFQIWLVSADGGDPQSLTAESVDQWLPQWAADGGAISFGVLLPGAGGIRLMDLATRTVRTLPGTQDLCCANPIPHDTRWLAMSSSIAPHRRIVVYDPRTRATADVYQGSFKYFNTSHDGRFVYFDSGIGDHPAINRIPIGGGEPERVADLEHVRRTLGLIGPWMDLAPDDSPMALRNTSSQQIYSLTFAPR